MAEAKHEPHPCSGCGRRVAYRYPFQRRSPNGGGKARVRHKCPHGEWCAFGKLEGVAGLNWPKCPKCLEERRVEYELRRKG